METALHRSVADATEIVSMEVRRGLVSTPGYPGSAGEDLGEVGIHQHHTVTVRVLDRNRPGSYVTDRADVPELSSAIRMALAHSRAQSPLSPPPVLPGPHHAERAQGTVPSSGLLFDPQIATLHPEAARALLDDWIAEGDEAMLRWSAVRILLVNSRGLRQQAQVTGVEIEVLSSHAGEGSAGRTGSAARGSRAISASGRARSAARRLEDLRAAEVIARARLLRPTEPVSPGDHAGYPAPAPARLVLAPEAVAALLDALNRGGLTSTALRQSSILSPASLGQAVFSPALYLVDDGMNPAGLAFPFDFAGWPRHRIELISEGVFRTPAAEPDFAAEHHLSPTPHFLDQGVHRATHLFLRPGTESEEELCRRAAGGLWIGRLTGIERTNPEDLSFRARAEEVREITSRGELAATLPNLDWEDRLERVFSEIEALSASTVTFGADPYLLESLCVPAMAVRSAGGFRAEPAPGGAAARTRLKKG